MALIDKKLKMSTDPEKSAEAATTAYTSGISGVSGINTPTEKSFAGAASSAAGGKWHAVDPQEEYLYWENNYASRDYVKRRLAYGISYGPAYRYGAQAFRDYEGAAYDSIEPRLRQGWEDSGQRSPLSWDEAKAAIRDAYQRLYLQIEKK